MADSAGTVFDVVILGGGSGGYACALRAAQLGMTVALVEKGKLGGTCLHQGCIPTKALLHAAEIADQSRESEQFGVRTSFDGIDMPGVNSYKDGVVARLYKGLQGLVKSRKITYVEGIGRLAGPTTVEVDGTSYEGRHIVLATGSVPKSLPGLDIDGERIITSDHALRLESVPASVVVLGGGVIGCEFASVWKSFGAEVTIVEALPHLVPLEDEAASKMLERAFRKRKIGFELGARFAGVEKTETGIRVSLENGKNIDADLLLVAVGRGPVSQELGYEQVGVEMERGFVKVDGLCQTNVPTISAVGDLIPTLQLAHVGFGEGILVAERLAGLNPAPIDYDGVPRVTYSEPEVASVGLTEAGAVDKYGQDVDRDADLRPGRQRQEPDPQDRRLREAGAPEGRPRRRSPHGRQPGRRAGRRGSADLQLGGLPRRGGEPHPCPPHPDRGPRRGSSRAGRQAPARSRLTRRRPRAHVYLGNHAGARRERD